jgi:hypothetical protein
VTLYDQARKRGIVRKCIGRETYEHFLEKMRGYDRYQVKGKVRRKRI